MRSKVSRVLVAVVLMFSTVALASAPPAVAAPVITPGGQTNATGASTFLLYDTWAGYGFSCTGWRMAGDFGLSRLGPLAWFTGCGLPPGNPVTVAVYDSWPLAWDSYDPVTNSWTGTMTIRALRITSSWCSALVNGTEPFTYDNDTGILSVGMPQPDPLGGLVFSAVTGCFDMANGDTGRLGPSSLRLSPRQVVTP